MVVTEDFEQIARATFASRGRDDHPLVVLPSTTAMATGDELADHARTVLAEMFADDELH